MQYGATTLNLASIIEQHARLSPDREAIVWNDLRIGYGELNRQANRVANALREMNVGYGDTVALVCPNLPFFSVIYFGILKTGAAVVPLNVLFKRREFAYHLQDSDARAVFVFEGTNDLPMARTVKEAFDQTAACQHLIVMTIDENAAAPVEDAKTLTEIVAGQSDRFDTFPTKPEDTCAILYTSGTTGQPKGAELTHSNIFLNAVTVQSSHHPASHFADGKQKTALITLPLFHTTGQTVQMNANFYDGNRVVLLPRFEARATLEAMERESVNFWVGVPTMYWAILRYVEESGFDPQKIRAQLKVASSGGAPMPVEVMKDFERVFGLRILEGYGLSETSPLACFNHFEKPSKPGTVGQPVFGVEIKCFDEDDCEVERGMRGEVVIRGHNIMKGYYKRPDATREAFKNGWFHTGDIGVIDADGYLSIVDRKKDMILRGGYNVYPRELEEVIMTHEAVSLVAVVGVADERLGEEVKAFVVLKPGFDLSAKDFTGWCREQFAANKYPRLVEFCDSLPISATGKILKRELRNN